MDLFRKGRTWETWPCAAFNSSLCQLKFIVGQAFELVKRKGRKALPGTLTLCYRVCKALRRSAVTAQAHVILPRYF